MLSRRSFLQLVGASLAATALQPTLASLASVGDETYQGRALWALPVYPTRNMTSGPIARLWPDSMTPILDQDDEWYQVANGWVRREGLQPMMPYDARSYQFVNKAPFWAEVASPIAPVRAYCAADAPLVTRIGHGGVSQVIDALPGEPRGWYGIANQQGGLLGWSQGACWRPTQAEMSEGNEPLLHLDCQKGLMTVYEGSRRVLEVPFSAGAGLQVGSFTPQRGRMGGLQWQGMKAYEGVGWQTLFGNGQTIAGIYWHNRFGQAVKDGPAVQMTPLLARWLYGWLGDNAHIIVEL